MEDLLDRASDPIYSEDVIKAATLKCRSLMGKPISKTESMKPRSNLNRPVSAFAVSAAKPERQDKCPSCNSHHDPNICDLFLAQSVEDRTALARKEGACFGCLRRGHTSRQCKNRRTCSECQGRHPTSLHKFDQDDSSLVDDQPTSVVTSHAVGMRNSVVVMSVVRVKVSYGSSSRAVEGLALLDNLSSGTFVTTSLLESLGVSGSKTRLAIYTLNGKTTENTQVLSGLRVQQPNGEGEVVLGTTYTKDVIPLQENEIVKPEMVTKFQAFDSLRQDVSELNMNLPVVLLIGADHPQALCPLEVRVGDPTDPWSPYAVRTRLGWSIMGPISSKGATGSGSRVSCRRTAILPNRIYGREAIDFGVAEMLTSIADVDFGTIEMPGALAGTMMANETMSGDDFDFMRIVERGTKALDGCYKVPLLIAKYAFRFFNLCSCGGETSLHLFRSI